MLRDPMPEEPQPDAWRYARPSERSGLDRAEEAAHLRRLCAERQARIAQEATS